MCRNVNNYCHSYFHNKVVFFGDHKCTVFYVITYQYRFLIVASDIPTMISVFYVVNIFADSMLYIILCIVHTHCIQHL